MQVPEQLPKHLVMLYALIAVQAMCWTAGPAHNVSHTVRNASHHVGSSLMQMLRP